MVSRNLFIFQLSRNLGRSISTSSSITGTILEATKTVTGFAPEVLLMTSIYDTLLDDDLPGFLCIKTQFWDKGDTDVCVPIRRRSMDGDWIWLFSKAVSSINDAEIPAIILEESIANDIDFAKQMSRTIRICSILIQAVEAAVLMKQKSGGAGDVLSEEDGSGAKDLSQIIGEDREAYQNVMDMINASGVNVPENVQDLQSLVQMAQKASTASNGVTNENASTEPELTSQFVDSQKSSSVDLNAVVESVRQGVRLDLGLTGLKPEEVKLVTLVLTGRLHLNQFASLLREAIQYGIGSIVDKFTFESERQSPRHLSRSNFETITERLFDQPRCIPPPISVVNLSYTYIGNSGIECLGQILYSENTCLKTLDISFCNIEEKGLLSLSRSLTRRKKRRIPSLRGLILSGNYFTPRAASEVGIALSPSSGSQKPRKRGRLSASVHPAGYDSDTESDPDDDDDDYQSAKKRKSKKPVREEKGRQPDNDDGLRVLHVANASLNAEATSRLLQGLGIHCTVRELNLSSNKFGAAGAAALVKVLETKARSRGPTPAAAMPFLDRLDMSNNDLGDEGIKQLTRAILKRSETHLVELRLSSNGIGAVGIETIMNKLLQHNLVSLSLDKNAIGDQGCQLVAASLQSMQSLARLNLGFNQIGSRGITSLMRSLVTCRSITYLGLSGNILRISGAIALAFTLSQHPRLEELELDNCCLGQAAQCHIVAGIISNRWVPMKRLNGFAVGPPMVAIGALDPRAANSSNEECLRIRKDEQMKTILQWMETNRTVRKDGGIMDQGQIAPFGLADYQNSRFLSPEYVSKINDVHGTPSQNAYLRLLGWLSRIPFDDDELTALQKYFYDSDGGEGDRGSDGYVNLKLRGDLLAALDGEVADEVREEMPSLSLVTNDSVGIDLDKLFALSDTDTWDAIKNGQLDAQIQIPQEEDTSGKEEGIIVGAPNALQDVCATHDGDNDGIKTMKPCDSVVSVSGRDRKGSRVKPRITMFPQFESQLEELKASATDLIEQEEDPMQHEVILTQYAEASLTILRQLRYHCMNSGLDGWRQSGLTRKILIVDDSMVTRKLVARAFEKANFIVDTASNGAEGVEKLKASLYDIAFMDIDMPVMNGFDATKKLREWEDEMRPGARQPICALTATYVDDFERSELMKFKEAGLDVMESKPCNIPRLLKVVDDVAPMFSDLSISVMQRERSDQSIQSGSSTQSYDANTASADILRQP
jgi:CheY-like chemotaxis protein/Ran GTPase-activating protein (RanGAP) involved in mRNA processing and transport